MDLEEKIKNCLERHPDWDDKRIAKSTGARRDDVAAVRRGEGLPVRETIVPLRISDEQSAEIREKVRTWKADHPAPGSTPCITLAAVREKLDVAAMIRRELGKVGKGQLLPEEEICRLTAGRDRNRFRRAVENNADEFRAHRIRLRLDESTDGKWYWGRKDDVAEALRIRDL